MEGIDQKHHYKVNVQPSRNSIAKISFFGARVQLGYYASSWRFVRKLLHFTSHLLRTTSCYASLCRPKSFPSRYDMFEDSLRATGQPTLETGSKLYVCNLDHGVTNEDIRVLFAEIGDLKRYAVHYNKNGRSSGSAEVIYTRRSDAFAALKRYNNVMLDGKRLNIEIIGSNSEVPVSARVRVIGVANGRRRRTVVVKRTFNYHYKSICLS